MIDQVTAELSSRGLGTTTVEILAEPAKWVKVHQPARERDGATNDDKRGYRVRITFTQPQNGPIFLGNSCHFGLGLFIPSEQT